MEDSRRVKKEEAQHRTNCFARVTEARSRTDGRHASLGMERDVVAATGGATSLQGVIVEKWTACTR